MCVNADIVNIYVYAYAYAYIRFLRTILKADI